MNKADDYIDLIDLVETSGESLIYLGDVREAIKQAQRDAIDDAIFHIMQLGLSENTTKEQLFKQINE